MTADQLHTHAMATERSAEQLATGLGQIGADPAAVKAVSQCADLFRKIAVSLAKGGTQPPQPPPTTDQAISNHFAQQRAAQAAPPQPPPAAPQPPAQ